MSGESAKGKTAAERRSTGKEEAEAEKAAESADPEKWGSRSRGRVSKRKNSHKKEKQRQKK